jgi:endonuclease YncB( thermonuclease family)
MERRFRLIPPLIAAVILAFPALAQEKNPTQPPPPAVPVSDVGTTPLDAIAAGSLEGTGQAIDGDEIAIGDVVFRLDGIAAPLMTVPMGPEARVALQALIEGERLSCEVLDRGADPRNLSGVCRVGDDDLAEALLAEGMAAVYRQNAAQDPKARERAARYDAAETEARERALGIWAKAATAEEIAVSEAPAEQPVGIDRDLVRNWLSLLPLVLLAVIAGIVALMRAGARRRAAEARRQGEVQSLLALYLAEVLAIRSAAESAQAVTAHIIQDLPIPTAQLANMALPEATVFAANAHRLKDLPREVSVDLVQFYTRYQTVRQILKQASALRCEQLRAAIQALIDSAEEPMARADKLLR